MTRVSRLRGAALGCALAFAGGFSLAAEAPADPAKRTRWGLYLTSVEAAAIKRQGEGRVLFVDVRDPIEIMFTGFAPMVDVNVPLMLASRGALHPGKPVFAMERNPTFAAEVMGALDARGLGEDAFVILMCRSGGERGAPSASALEETGLKHVIVVVDGFEGDASRSDPEAPWRDVNGWKYAGLPWSYALDPEKVRPRP
jgi:rhodanese-related sulfurtransferase